MVVYPDPTCYYPAMRLGCAAALIDGEFVPGDVEVDSGRISRVGLSPPGKAGLATPGLVDLQVNGFAGVDFAYADPAGYQHAGHELAPHGVTAYQPTLVSLPIDHYPDALANALDAQRLMTAPRLLGVHLEGPFLAEEWAGAHDRANLIAPDTGTAAGLLMSGPVGYMTLAPERPGALELISWLVDQGIVVALGHSGADADTAHAGFDRGASAVTHIFNAHRRWGHRDPGLAGAGLTRPGVVVQVIPDHAHLAPETLLMVFAAAGGRVAVVTDAVAAAGIGPGRHRLAGREVVVSERGTARLADGTIAGSTLTMDQAVRNLIEIGIGQSVAIGAATTVPARLVGRPELGTLAPGSPADLVVWSDRIEVRTTMVAGEIVFDAG